MLANNNNVEFFALIVFVHLYIYSRFSKRVLGLSSFTAKKFGSFVFILFIEIFPFLISVLCSFLLILELIFDFCLD